MNCLVTGATGFVGSHLCQRLCARGDALVALSRGGRPLADGSSTRPVDLVSEAVAPALLAGVDTVFHLAGVAHRLGAAGEYAALNVQATVSLARQAAQCGVRCFIFVSSVKAMGAPAGDAPRREADGVVPEDVYGRSKWRAEQALRADPLPGDMSVVILRPPLLYGAGVRGNLHHLARAAGRGLPRPPPGGRRSMLAVEDLVDLMCRLADRPPPGVHTWLAAGGDYSTREVYDILRRAQGRAPGRAWLPRAGWRFAASAFDRLAGGGGESTWNRLFGTELYDSSAVIAASGWRPARRLEDVAADLLPRAGA